METTIIALTGMLLAGLGGFFMASLKSRAVERALHNQCERLAGEKEQLQADLRKARDLFEEKREQLQSEEVKLARSTADAENMRQQLQGAVARTEDYKCKWEESLAAREQLQTRFTELETTLAQKQDSFDQQFRQLEQNRESLTKEFERLASQVLEKKSQNFKELNRESLMNLLTPIQSEMKGFREKVEKIHEKDSEQRIILRTELEQLQKLNQDITAKADKLATALQGQKKTQGNWGELMLENVLDSSGLRLGTDYQREVSFQTEDGRQRPDAIVYLPQNKHLVIDAKTSLAAYTRAMNAEDETERQQALKEHAAAVSDRINELSDRNYYQLPGLNSPEIVIMFIPVESAYVEALKYDGSIYQRAIERNVLVATPTTLLTSLNIVRQLWRFEDQNKHTAELASRAEKFYQKLNSFLGSMQTVGKQLDKAKDSYNKAFSQLYSGRGNLIKQAAEFKELGVAVNKELPAELTDKASLELEHVPDETAAES